MEVGESENSVALVPGRVWEAGDSESGISRIAPATHTQYFLRLDHLNFRSLLPHLAYSILEIESTIASKLVLR
jgi:hypothetical protein